MKRAPTNSPAPGARPQTGAGATRARRQIGFTLNAVVHRRESRRARAIIAMAEQLGVDRLEIANVQYYGWAIENRDSLMPTRAQLELPSPWWSRERQRLKGECASILLSPDYYARYPKACMGGWGRSLMLIDPGGTCPALPCRGMIIPETTFENVRQKPLSWIWAESPSFQRFRGEDWMPDPCRTCERRALDFGGCRCQALLLTGDAAATDPSANSPRATPRWKPSSPARTAPPNLRCTQSGSTA